MTAKNKKGDGLRYLGLRKGKKWWRARLYWLDERTSKERERRVTFPAESKALAMLVRDEKLAEAQAGASSETKRRRFREVSAEYLATAMAHSSKLSAESHVRFLNKHFGDWWLDKVTVRAMQEYLDALGIDSSNNRRNALVGIWRTAVKKHYATTNLAKLTEPRRRSDDERQESEDAPNKALTPAEVAALLDHLEEHEPNIYSMTYVQYVTGCRFAELSALRREDVDLESGLMRIRRGQFRGVTGGTKARYARTAGLPLEVRAVLRQHLDRMAVEQWPGWQELVFPRPVSGRRRASDHWACTTIGEALRRSFRSLGIAVAGSTHVARHTMISIADELATPDAVLRMVVGHRSKKIHEGYKHPRDAKVIQLADAVGRAMRTGRSTGTSNPPSAEHGQKEG